MPSYIDKQTGEAEEVAGPFGSSNKEQGNIFQGKVVHLRAGLGLVGAWASRVVADSRAGSGPSYRGGGSGLAVGVSSCASGGWRRYSSLACVTRRCIAHICNAAIIFALLCTALLCMADLTSYCKCSAPRRCIGLHHPFTLSHWQSKDCTTWWVCALLVCQALHTAGCLLLDAWWQCGVVPTSRQACWDRQHFDFAFEDTIITVSFNIAFWIDDGD
jgi:hypothetical protein